MLKCSNAHTSLIVERDGKKVCLSTTDGGYPVYWILRGFTHGFGYQPCESVLCAECATAYIDKPKTSLFVDVYWEGPDLECEECGDTIESAYGDPDEEQDSKP